MEWYGTYFSVLWKEIGDNMLIHEFIAIKRNDIPQDIQYDIIKNKNCVKVSDDIILANQRDFLSAFKAHWGCIGSVHEGLDYHGITIVLHEDLTQFITVLCKYKERSDIQQLIKLCQIAMEQNEDIIHFGI